MSSLIVDTRHDLGLTVRDLAHRLGVAPSSVTRMEHAERDNTIKLKTLERALAAMGRVPRLEVVSERREERVAMERHRVLAVKLKSEPSAVLALVPGNLNILRERLTSPIGRTWVDRWETLLSGPVDQLIEVMLVDSIEGRELRQNSPFAGALSQTERQIAIQMANR